MKKLLGILFVFGAVVVTAACSGNDNGDSIVDFWPSEAPGQRTIETALWELDVDELGFDSNKYILSVSPSGMNILVVQNGAPNLQNRRRGNRFGQEVEYIAMYSIRNGRFVQAERIYIETISGHRWNDIIAGACETSVAWNDDEMRVLIAGGNDSLRTIPELLGGFSSIFLVDFDRRFVEDLTGRHIEPVDIWEGGYTDTLPRWLDADSISFIRYESDADGMLVTSLMRMNLRNGSEALWAGLSNHEDIIFVSDYAIYDDRVYYIKDTIPTMVRGFYYARLTGGRHEPVQLLSVYNVLGIYDFNRQPFNFLSVEVSDDGRWALLTKLDNRALQRDIPTYPSQPDPRTAMSYVHRRPWVGHHNVILFDLYNNKIANPFVDERLSPYELIITAATFAPDGKSILVAAFGDEEVWTLNSFAMTTLWQVNLDTFDAIRIFRAIDEDYYSMTLTRISWLKNNSLWIRQAQMANPIWKSHIIVIPAAFERLVD